MVETHVFSKTNFLSCLAKTNKIWIKPLVGPELLQVMQMENGQYALCTKNDILQCFHIDELYEKIRQNIVETKQYLLQSFPPDSSIVQQSYYTLHRKSRHSNWRVVHKTTIEQAEKKKVYDLFRQWNLLNLLLNIGETLGEAFPHCSSIVVEIARTATDFLCVDTILHYRNSKWSQFHSLGSKRFSRSFIPKTELCTTWTLDYFLRKYNVVVLKPCVGQQGRGIVKIQVTANQTYEVQSRNKKKDFHDFAALLHYIQQTYLAQSDYLIQQYIHLRTIDECPYDIRVITQLDADKWIVTGVLIKVAAKNFFITNRAQKLLMIDSLGDFSLEKSKQSIEKLCVKVSKSLEEHADAIIGFDIAFDLYGKVWILEANYSPSLAMFYGLGNNEMYTNIYHYIRLQKMKNKE